MLLYLLVLGLQCIGFVSFPANYWGLQLTIVFVTKTHSLVHDFHLDIDPTYLESFYSRVSVPVLFHRVCHLPPVEFHL